VNEVAFPGIGSAEGFAGKPTDKETFYSFTGFTTPTTIFRYDMTTGKSTVFRQPKVEFNPADYETKQVFYTSKDGTKVPMFITHKKGVKLDGNNPTYRLRWLQHLPLACFFRRQPRLDGDGRRLRATKPARWRRVWRRVAQGWNEAQEAECV
jgi:hypothetical protein